MAYTYEIPDNFVETGRVIHGMFETRGFIEGCILGGIGLLVGLLIPMPSLQSRISELVLAAGPGFVLGVVGINGDRVSTTIINMYHYARTKKIMFYDGNPRALVDAPVEKMMDEVTIGDQILQYIDNKKQEKLRKKMEQEYIYGENFEFADDKDYAREYIDPDAEDDEDEADVEHPVSVDPVDGDDFELVFDETTEEALPFIPFIDVTNNDVIEDVVDDDIPVIAVPSPESFVVIRERATGDDKEDDNGKSET